MRSPPTAAWTQCWRIPLLPIDQSLGRPFPAQDRLQNGESGSGYGLRMACRNGLSFGELAEVVESPGHRYLSAKSVKYVAYLFGASPTELARAMPIGIRERGRDMVVFQDVLFTRAYLLRHAWPRLCPACVFEDGFAKAYWEVSIVTACWKHRCRLLDECFYCSRKITWRRPGLLECFCGASYVDQLIKVDDVSELEFSASVDQKLNSDPPFGIPACRPLFRLLSLNSLLRLVWSLGVIALMPEGKAVPGKVTRAPDVAGATRLVRAALMAIDASAASNTPVVPAWLGAELDADLTVDEEQVICSYIPRLATIDNSVQRSVSAQLRLSLGVNGEGK